VPATGYELLPSVYWTWSESEASVINAWAATTNGHHRAVAGGNLWLRTWLDSSRDMVRRYDDRLRAPAEETVTVLCTLQPGYTDDRQLALLADAARASPPGWRWWLRLHPVMSQQERQQIAGVVARVGRLELEEPSTLPLYALLRATSAHVTYSSSTVLEAAEFGVRSVLTSDDWAAAYPQAVEDGTVIIATTPEELLRSIAAQSALRQLDSPTSSDSAARPDRLLRELMST
jgi:hypothetical protein